MKDNTNRLLAIHIMEILNKYSDASHTMSQAELMKRLEEEYNDKISRHTCSDYLRELRSNGYIIGARGVYRKDLFSERELRTLIDGVMYGKHIPEKEAKILIEKLKSLSSNNMRTKAKNLTYLSAINRTKNESLYEILDVIDDAIEKGKKIEIVQYSPQIDGTNKEWPAKIVDPYYVVSDQSRYYLLCNVNRDDKPSLEPRRIDRITKIKMLNEQRVPLDDIVGHDFNLGNYMKEHVYMFSGETGIVELKIDNKAIGYLEDWHGDDYKVLDTNEEYSIVRLKTNYNAIYYWLLQYGSVVEVLEPVSLREKVIQGLEEVLSKYKCQNN